MLIVNSRLDPRNDDRPRVNLSTSTSAKKHDIHLFFAFLSLAIFGFIITLINIGFPAARNALDYEKGALELLAHHFNVSAVVHEPDLTGGKPILFSLLAAPFASIWNANSGVVTVSFIGTVFFLWTVTLTLPRLNELLGINQRLLTLEFILTALNPLVIYQFWSGYPDSLFAGLVLLAFFLIDTIVRDTDRDTRLHIVALGLVILVAIHTKLYGAILVLSCSLYVFLNLRKFLSSSHYLWTKLALLCVAFLACCAALIGTKFGINPILILDSGAGFDNYLAGIGGALGLADFRNVLLLDVVSILLIFQVSLLFLLASRARHSFAAAPTTFFVIYLAGLLPSPGADFNMRYLLPIFPFLAPAVAVGAQLMPRAVRSAVLSIYAIVAVFLILTFNIASVEEPIHPFLVQLLGRQLDLQGMFDNLRLPTQIVLKRQIDVINAEVPAGSTLYWSSDYYGKATHGLAHDLGVKRDLKVEYVLDPSDVPASSSAIFLTEFTSTVPPAILPRVPAWATPVSLKFGLFRLDPIFVELVSLSGDYVETAAPIKLRANVIARDHSLRIQSLAISDGIKQSSVVAADHMDVSLEGLMPGRHVFIAQAIYGTGNSAVSDPLVIYSGTSAFERTAKSKGDLFDEDLSGGMEIASSTLALDQSERFVGIHFEHIMAVRGTRLVQARLRFVAATAQTRATKLTIRGQRSDNAPSFAQQNGNLSARPATLSEINWEVAPWSAVGEAAYSPNLAPIFEEIFGQDSWKAGRSVLLLIRVSGAERLVEASGENGRNAPILYLECERKVDCGA